MVARMTVKVSKRNRKIGFMKLETWVTQIMMRRERERERERVIVRKLVRKRKRCI